MTILRTTAATAMLLAAAQAHAFDWSGYFRAGPGATSEKGVSRACYGLSGPGLKYRLGNECDIYGEFTLGHDAKVEGIDVRGVLMTNFSNNATDSGDEKLGIEQIAHALQKRAAIGVAPRPWMLALDACEVTELSGGRPVIDCPDIGPFLVLRLDIAGCRGGQILDDDKVLPRRAWRS